MTRKMFAASVMWMAVTALVLGQGTGRPASPAGSSATQIGGTYAKSTGSDELSYQGGKWIEITYGRPIKRGRELWGTGADYGKKLNSGAPVWRAGANVSTRLKTEMPIVIAGKTVPAGEYSVFVDLKPRAWTFILSSWGAQQQPNDTDKTSLWGSFNYTPAKDVVRAPMTLSTLPFSIDQLTWDFVDMTNAGGKLALMWDKNAATIDFSARP